MHPELPSLLQPTLRGRGNVCARKLTPFHDGQPALVSATKVVHEVPPRTELEYNVAV